MSKDNVKTTFSDTASSSVFADNMTDKAVRQCLVKISVISGVWSFRTRRINNKRSTSSFEIGLAGRPTNNGDLSLKNVI